MRVLAFAAIGRVHWSAARDAVCPRRRRSPTLRRADLGRMEECAMWLGIW